MMPTLLGHDLEPTSKTHSILIVEDEIIIARDIARTLERLGYRIVGIAATAEVAIRAAINSAPDLVMMDIRLRGQPDGIAAANSIHEKVDVPIVFLTAFADTATLERAKLVEPDGYIIKPFQEEDLRVGVELAIRRHDSMLRLKKASSEAQNLVDEHWKWTSDVAHDLRNPVAAVLLNAGMLLRKSKSLSPEALDRRAHAIQTSAGRLRRLVDDLLTTGSFEEHRVSLNIGSHRARDLVSAAIEMFEVQVCDASLELHMIESEALDVEVRCDSELLILHVFGNLLANAIKFSPVGGSIVVDAEADAHWLTFSVRDRAGGIAAEAMEHIFERYWRPKGALQPGSGLGLAIAKNVVEAHGGAVGVESAVPQGSRFWFRLPRDRGDREHEK